MAPKTNIIVTLGPATSSKDVMKELIHLGVSFFRLNFSWGDRKEHEMHIANIREVAKEMGVVISIIADLSGPRVSTEDGHKFDENHESIITSKDIEDINQVKELDIEYIAMSYVGSAKDIVSLRSVLEEKSCTAKIIAKIERISAVRRAEEIIDVCDMVMVARGDLGNEVPLEKIPYIESDIITIAKRKGKEAIVATELMSSMIRQARPSRADVTDVAFAVMCGASAVMLSNETAVGDFPIESVQMMKKIIVEAESVGMIVLSIKH